MNFKGESYEIKLNLKAIKQIESVLGRGIVAIIRESGGMLSVNDLLTIAGYAMYNADGNRVSPKQGQEIAEAYLMEHGYASLVTVVVEAIERDCPFFFQVD